MSNFILFPSLCRGRASWILKQRSLSRGRNTRSPPHPHGASARTHTHAYTNTLRHMHQSSHILRDSGGHGRTHADPHTQACTRTHLKSVACCQARLGGGGFSFFFFLQSFYFLFVSCKLRDIGDGWERGCSTSSALLWALAHHCISHHAVDVYRACRSQQVPWKIGSYLGVMPRQSLNSKSLVFFFCFSVNLCLIGWTKQTKNTFPAGWRLLCCWGQKDEHFRGLQRASAVAL